MKSALVALGAAAMRPAMQSALTGGRQAPYRYVQMATLGLVALAGVGLAQPAQASTGVACLLAGKVVQVQPQPLNELMARVQIQQVKDDNTLRNDVECSKQFRTGDVLWVSLNARDTASNGKPAKAGDRIWLSFRYGDDRSGTVWRKYESIPQGKYLERKNGIQ